ncbi:hypothetical protein SAE02_61450 [Skermanella aerolata]|uniref:Uncharacterized protein n=2 Tax=Skermanella aerolata TaxID=393310 RepID=A0A512DZT4_9PROT|nr:hypothetical protein N826_25605 [Skermanella aerolata KACC 11604]GEO41997.1 hypothetical protein SAE02_61450 [Skermanella aerolata]
MRPKGRPRNDGLPPGTVPMVVFISPETGEIVPRPRGRPSNFFLNAHRQIEVPPGKDPETHVREILSGEKAPARGKKASKPAAPAPVLPAPVPTPAPAAAEAAPKSEKKLFGAALASRQRAEAKAAAEAAQAATPVRAETAQELPAPREAAPPPAPVQSEPVQASPVKAAPETKAPVAPAPERSAAVKSAADLAREAIAKVPSFISTSVGRFAEEAAQNVQGAAAQLMAESSASEGETHDQHIAFLRARVEDLARQRDAWRHAYIEECALHQQETDRLSAAFEALFENSERDRRAFRDELALAFRKD